MYCHACGTQMPEDSRHCRMCGTALVRPTGEIPSAAMAPPGAGPRERAPDQNGGGRPPVKPLPQLPPQNLPPGVLHPRGEWHKRKRHRQWYRRAATWVWMSRLTILKVIATVLVLAVILSILRSGR